jgi:HSP20 family protein
MLKLLKKDKVKKIEDNEIIEDNEAWIGSEENNEGQLAVDVCQTDKTIIIQSTIAGVKPENLNISLNHDLLTIKGKREANDKIKNSQYLYQECYWGSFSRSIILPSEVDNKKIDAELENGVLTIILKKAKPSQVSIKVKD